MIAAISLMRRRAEVDLHRFRRHWLDVHGPLVCQFPALRHYVQLHVLDSPATNATARALDIDGFPILQFDNDADRQLAHGSAPMAACNEDSRLFIGAVARVITEQIDVLPPAETRGRMRMVVLYPEAFAADAVDRHLVGLRQLPRVQGLRRYRVRQQGRAPASVIPHLAANVAAVAQVWFDSLVALEAAAAACGDPAVAVFAAEEHRLP